MAASQVPTKGREERDTLGCGYLNVITKALTFSPSIVSYAGEQGAEIHCKLHSITPYLIAKEYFTTAAIFSFTPHFLLANPIQPIVILH